MPLLQIDIEARYAQFRDAMNRIERQTQASASNMSKAFEGVKNTLATLGVAAGAGALVSVVKNAIDAADHLNDLAKQTGVAVDTLGGLGFAAGQAGGDLESIADAAGKLNKSIAGAAGGNKEFSEAFKLLGIDIKNASGELKTADQVMVELANKFEEYADGPEKVAIAQRLLGKSGAEMIAFLNDGGKAIQENIDFYKRYAGVTQETADRADAFNDTLGKIEVLAGSFGRTLAAELLPTLQNVSGALLDSAENGNEFNKWAERAAGVVNVLAQAVPPAVTGLDYLATRASLAAGLVKAALDLSPEKGAEAWRKYGEAMKQWAADANKRSENFKNPAASTGLESSLKALENDIKSEKDLLTTRNQVIQNYRNSGDLSEKQAQAARAVAHKESVENTKRLYGEEIAALVEAKKKAKTAAEADSIQSSIDAIAKKQLLVGNAKERAPVLPSSSGAGAKTAVFDSVARSVEDQNRGLERLSEREREILADRSEFLQSYYQDDLISISDYYAGRRAAQDEALQNQQANINQEIASLEGLKPKDARQKADVDGKINALIEKRSMLQASAGLAAIQLSIDETRAAKAFQDTLAGINAELLEQQGLLPQAAGIRFDQGNERIKTRLTTERDAAFDKGDTATVNARNADLEKLATLRKLAVAQAELNSVEEIGARVQSTLNETSERAALGAKAGSVSELESLRAISDARLQAVADLQQVATALDEVAQSTGDPRMVEQAKSMQLEVDKLAASADLVRERFEDAFSGPFESALQKMIDGTASFRDVIKGLFGDIASEFTRMAARDFTKQMLGKEGIFGGAVDFAAQIFGGESKAPKASADVASALTKAAGGLDTAAASAQVTMLGTAATGASTAMGVLTTSALPSLVAAAEAAAAALSTVSASGSSGAGGGIFGAVAGMFGSGGNVPSSASYASLDLLASKAGNIFDKGDVVPFAKGGIPSIVSTPTYFPMKNGGTGLMGEAGPEAIMPLARDPGGELAVRMVGDRGDVTLLPITRDGSGRMAVRARAEAFANGGVFGGVEPLKRARVGQIIDQASMSALSARTEAVAVPIGVNGADQGGTTKGGDTYLTVQVTPPAGSSSASAQQWGATAGRQIKRSLGRNT